MIAFAQDPVPRWMGILDFPISSDTFEEFSEEPELADVLLEDVARTAQVLRCLRNDGWEIELRWEPGDGTYFITHPRYRSAEEANQRLAELGIKAFKCHDLREVCELFFGATADA